MKATYSSDPLGLTADTYKLLLSEGRTVVKCICECNQSGLRVVFDPEPVAMSTTFCVWCFSARCYCSVPWIRGSKERSSQNSRPQDERAKRAKGEVHCFDADL